MASSISPSRARRGRRARIGAAAAEGHVAPGAPARAASGMTCCILRATLARGGAVMKFAPLVALLVGACTAPNPYYDPLQILPPAPDLSGRWSTVDDGDMGAAPDLRAAPADMATCSTQGQSVDDGGVCCVGLDAIDGVCCVTCWRTPTDGVRACNVPHPTGAPCISAFCNWCASGICDLPTPEPDPFNPGQCR